MILILGSLLLWLPCLWAAGPITPSGLNTQVSDPIIVGAHTQYNITGGTRPEGGANLFHSFGDFNVPPNNIANFQNTLVNGAFPHTDNILARVTGTNGNNPTLSSIYGTIQTSNFENANLFLMNPAGFLFGPNATINVGGMMTFTTADYIRLTGSGRFNANPNDLSADILTAAPVAAFGFLDPTVAPIAPITVYGMTVQGPMPTDPDTGAPLGQKVALVGGNITFTSDPKSGTPSIFTAPGRQIQITSVAGKGKVTANSFMPETGMVLGIITLDPGTVISTAGDPSFGDGSGGPISIRGGQFVATSATVITSPAEGSFGSGGAVTVNVTGSATIADSLIQTSSFLAGAAGAVSVTANESLTLTNSFIDSETSGGRGDSGPVSLTTNGPLSLTDSVIVTSSDVSGNSGAVTVRGKDVALNGVVISTSVSGDPNSGLTMVRSGAVTLTAENTLTLSSSPNITSFIGTAATGTLLDASPITITGTTVKIQGSTIDASVHNSSFVTPANGGAIEIRGGNVNVAESNLFSFNSGAQSTGAGGSIRVLEAEQVNLTASIVNASATSGGGGGNIEFQTKGLTISNNTDVSTSSFGPGAGGTITVRGAENVTVESGSRVLTDVVLSAPLVPQGTAGNILIETQNLAFLSGGQIGARALPLSTGNAGNITVQGTNGPANSVLIDGPGSGIVTDTQGTGAGGNIFVNANTVTLQNGGTLSAKTSGTTASATGGTITVEANQVQLNNGGLITASTTGAGAGGSITIGAGSTFASSASTVSSTATQAQGGNIAITAGQSVTLNNGASISASSTGAGDAGDILINAGQNYTSTNSAVTTQATAPGTEASGGNITVLATDMVQLTNSQLNASVQGSSTTVGGNITIDPQYVILQNSQILAQATQGQGGAISINITNGGLYLPDANSTVSASSQFGVNGTVTIQSPNAPGAGEIQPLGKTPLQATSLLNQRCAALAGGEFSSFTVAGRDSLPTEPGSWLTSPLYAAGTGPGMKAEGGKAEGRRPVARGEDPDSTTLGTSLDGETPLLSLRQIAPAGFLTQAFAVDWSASCQS
jgi:filamentous hemagglutinin family protein